MNYLFALMIFLLSLFKFKQNNSKKHIPNAVRFFVSIYSTLYNSADTSTDMLSLKEKLKTEISNDSIMEVAKVTGNAVKEAAARMKPKKSDISNSYTSDAILNAPDIFFDLMALVYRSWLVHGTVTLSLLSCAFLPLFKGGLKDPAKTDSYRAIAGSSLLLKLFDNLIIILWGDRLGTDSLQFGLKSGTSTTECSWLVMEVASYYLRRGTPALSRCWTAPRPLTCVSSALSLKNFTTRIYRQ